MNFIQTVVYLFLITYTICRGTVSEELLKGNELEKLVLINFHLFRNRMLSLVEIWIKILALVKNAFSQWFLIAFNQLPIKGEFDIGRF